MYSPHVEVPTSVLAWLHTQSKSAFCGDMLRVIQREGGLTEAQLKMVLNLKGGK